MGQNVVSVNDIIPNKRLDNLIGMRFEMPDGFIPPTVHSNKSNICITI